MSNLRQLAHAMEIYSGLYGAAMPAVRYENPPGIGLTTIAWDWVQRAGVEPTPGPLWNFTDNPGHVQQCPDCTEHSTFGADPYTGYNYNTTYIAGEGRFPLMGWNGVRRGLPISIYRRTSTCALFGDGGWRGGANKFMRAPSGQVEGNLQMAYGGGQAFRHSGTTNVAYLDGHTASVNRMHKGAHATEALLQIMDDRKNGFLSDDDSAYDPR